MARVSRSRVNGVYQGLATASTDYNVAFNRLYQELIRSPKYQTPAERTALLATLNALPRDYRGFRLAMVASMEQVAAFIGNASSFGSEHDGAGRPVIGFGFDFERQRGHFLNLLGAARISISPRVRAILEAYDALPSRMTPAQGQAAAERLLSDLDAAGFQITRAQAVNLFQVTADDPRYTGEVNRIFQNIPDSVEKAVLLAAVYNGITTGPFNRAVVAGRFEEAYVIMAFTTAVNQDLHERPMINAAVFGRTSAGDPGVISLTSALDFVDAMQIWQSSIVEKRDNLSPAFHSDFDGQMNALKAQIDEVTRKNGMFVSYTGQDDLSSIASRTGTNLNWLQQVYARGPGKYQSIFLPETVPNQITGTFRPSDTPSGTSHVVVDTGANFFSFAIANTERPRSTFMMDRFGRPVGAFDAGPGSPAFRPSRNSDGSITLLMPNGSTIRYLSQDGVDHPVEIIFTGVHGGAPIRRTGDAFFTVDGDGTYTVRQRYQKTEFTHNDLNQMPGFAECVSLPGMAGRVAFAGPGAAYPTEGVVDLDGEVTTETSERLDGTKTVTISFNLDNRGAGVGDPITQILVYRPGQDFAYSQTVTRAGRDAVVTERRVNNSGSEASFWGIDPEVSIDFPDKVITFEQFGSIFGSTIGKHIAGGNVAAQIGLGALLGTVTANLGEIADNFINNPSTANGQSKFSSSQKIDEALHNLPQDLLNQLKSAGIGALSSFLTAELFDALGVSGTVGDFGQAITGSYVSALMEALPALVAGTKTVGQVLGTVNVANIAGSFLGSKLASQVVTFDTIGGQLGASIGSAVGSIVGGKIIGQLLGSVIGGPLGGLVGSFVGAFVGQLLGGLIGSVFGGTPRSGADVDWNEQTGQFTVANAYSRKGGSKDAAVNLSTAVADSFNSILQASGSVLLDPTAVQAGNYGMRKSDYVYRPIATQEKSAITARFSGKNGAASLLRHGTYLGLSSMIGQMAAGDTVIKRAILANLANAHGNPESNQPGAAGDFSLEALMGDITVAHDYNLFLEDTETILGMIAAEPNSNFAAGWAITFQRARELGLHRRASTDWTGGYGVWLDSVLDGSLGGEAVSAANVGLLVNGATGNRTWVIYDSEGNIREVAEDEIDTSAQTDIVGTSGRDVIRLSVDSLLAPAGGENQLLSVDGQAQGDQAIFIDVSARIEAEGGDDEVHASDRGDTILGGDGSDTLYGGRLDDWLIGGEGTDHLHAGNQAGGLGGDGNYLDGGAGDDFIHGREGSDWLEGGSGNDVLEGGDGDDILSGGAGTDTLKGGRGNDQYIVRFDAGNDSVDEVATATVVRDTTRGQINWLGDAADVARAILKNKEAVLNNSGERFTAAVSADGDDAIVFGAGIEMGDLELKRSGTATAPGADLMIKVKSADGTFSELAVKDWFTDPVKRIEWLKFADGNEIRIGDTVNFIVGTPGNDLIIGTEYADFVVAGDGDDEVHLLGGDDFGSGGTGDDILFGDGERDIIVGGLGRDTLHGGSDKDMLSGDDGADEIDGGEGDDTVSGGRGDDLLKGGTGNDVFKFSRGDGRDTIVQEEVVSTPDEELWVAMTDSYGRLVNGYHYDRETGELMAGDVTLRDEYHGGFGWRVPIRWRNNTLERYTGAVTTSASGSAGSDRIAFEVGINVQDLVFDTSGPDLIIGVGRENANGGAAADFQDRITIRDWNGASAPGGRPVKEMVFYQAGTVDIGAGGKVLKGGTAGDDSLTGGAGQDWITGAGGRDSLAGQDGDDILAGGGDDDQAEGGAGNDVLYGGAGQDVLSGGEGGDVLSGGDDDDMLVGGAGADLLVGGGGIDTASYAASSTGVTAGLDGSMTHSGDAAGDTFDSVENLTGSGLADHLAGDEGENVLEGGDGADLLRGQGGDDIYVWERGDGDDVIVEGFEEALDPAGGIGSFYSENWTSSREWIWYSNDGPPRFEPMEGSEDFNEGYYNYSWSLSITGAAGEEIFSGSSAGASQSEMPRDAVLAGGVWKGGFARTGNGQQVARGSTEASPGSDTLEFGAGISLSHLSFEQQGSDLVITVAGEGSGAIRVRGHFPDAILETLQFHDGAAVSLRGFAIGSRLASSAGGLVVGTSAGTEILYGFDGNDVLFGGEGLNRLWGGRGDDVYEAGTGRDFISDMDGGVDTVRYVGSAAAVQVNLASGTFTGGSAELDSASGVENVTGSAFDDTLIGNGSDNRLLGLGGNNILSGGYGDDVLVALDGADSLDGGEGEDALSGGGGNDVLLGGGGKDFLDGGAGLDRLDGGDGDDRLTGGDGQDIITGGLGADLISGGGDVDTLDGGGGNDVYSFETGSGVDTVTDEEGANTVVFGDSITPGRLWLSQVGFDLRIGVIGSDDAVVIHRYFATSGLVSHMRSIQAGGSSLALNRTGVAALIQRMTAISTGTPTAMDSTIGTDFASFWNQGASNDAPADLREAAGGAITIAEGTAIVTGASGAAARLIADDADGDTITWSIATEDGVPQDGGGLFGIDASTGALIVLDSTRINLDLVASHVIKVRATDSAGGYSEKSITVNVIEDANERPTDLTLLDIRLEPVAERDRLAGDNDPATWLDSRPAIVLGTVSVTDADLPTLRTGRHSFMVFENGSAEASGRFAVVDGQLQLRAGAELNYEFDGASIDLRIVATDFSSNPLPFERTFTFAIGDVIDVLSGDEGDNGPLAGQSGQDLILGLGGRDLLVGGAGPDTLDGGAGTDTAGYFDSAAGITADLEAQTVSADGAIDTLISIEGIRGSEHADTLLGSSGNDILEGGAGHDSLDGRGGADYMAGGLGDDSYVVDDAGDSIVESGGEGVDEVRTALASYTLAQNVETLVGTATTGTQHLRDNYSDNVIRGTARADIISISAGGSDMAFGNEGDDVFFVGGALTAADRLNGGAGNDTLLFQGTTYVVLTAEVAGQIEHLSFKAGTDTTFGVSGNYNYYISVADSLVLAGAQMRVNASQLLASELLVFDGSAETDGSFYILAGFGRDDLKGGANGDIFFVDAGRYQSLDRFDGGAGTDQVQFRGNTNATLASGALAGIESILLLSGGTTKAYAYNLILSDGNVEAGQVLTVDGTGLHALEGFTLDAGAETDGRLELKGGAGNDTLTGGAGSDRLDGGAGADILAGGAGEDTYVVDHVGDAVIEADSQGTDLVATALASYTLGAHVEALAYTGTGTDAFTGTGNSLDNLISGGAGDDWLTGGSGRDTLIGADGTDTASYATSAAGVSVDLATGWNTGGDAQGDWLMMIENVIGSGHNDVLTGDASANALLGGLGDDLIRGGGNADQIDGGAGNDTADYAGDSGAAIVNLSAASVTAGGHVVAARTARDGGGATDSLTGIENVRGSSFDDTIHGNDDHNVLDGGAGADAMVGGAGNDIYLVDNAGDIVTEAAGQGDDEVRASAAAYTLTAEVERLTGTSASGQSLTGNAGANVITGNDGADRLDGGAGGDTLKGGKGNDSYVVDNALDQIIEIPGEGTADHVSTSLRAYTLGAELENLTSTVADGATSLYGNSADNVIVAGSADDLVVLLAGGKDNVSTGAGNDSVVVGPDFDSNDRIDFGAGTDALILRGGMTLAFQAWHLNGAERITILSGLDPRFGVTPADTVLAHYNLTAIDANVGAGATLHIDAGLLFRDESVRFDGSAETDGSFLVWLGGGTDTFIGGARDDIFAYRDASAYGVADRIVGGGGIDTLQLSGTYNLTFAASTMAGIETLELVSGQPLNVTNAYNITMADGNVAAGALLTVNGASLAAGEGLVFNGSAESDGRFLIIGGAGRDEVRGGAGSDVIRTGAGNDTIYLRSAAEDIVDGGAGSDTVDLSALATKVVVNLATSGTLTSIEAVIGGSAGDELTGSDSDNRLEGGAGNDILVGGKGADQLIGGSHVAIVPGTDEFGSRGGDTVSYANAGPATTAETLSEFVGGLAVDDDGDGSIDRQALATRELVLNGVRVSLADNVIGTGSFAAGGEAAGDQFLDVENLLGSSSNDRLRGTNNASDVSGGLGDDLIYGGAGDDRLYGGGDNDILYGQSGVDELHGGDGDDRLFGEEKGDHLHGEKGNDILVGGSGNDHYYFRRGEGNDRIFNYDPTNGFDHLSLGEVGVRAIFYDNIWFERVNDAGAADLNGNHLRLIILGGDGSTQSDGTITVDDWFRKSANPNLFTIDLVTDSGGRATVDIKKMLQVMSGLPAPTSQAQMNAYLQVPAFSNAVEQAWDHLNPPTLTGVVDKFGVEPRDGAAPEVIRMDIRAFYQDLQGRGLEIPPEGIKVDLVTTDGSDYRAYATFDPGIATIQADGSRTVTLTLTPNGSTHLLANGSLPLKLTARLDGVIDATDSLTAAASFNLRIDPTADTPTLAGSSLGGNAGTLIAINLTTDTPDKDGSEKVDVLIGNLPAGYSLTSATGAPVGTWQGYDPAAKALTLVNVDRTGVQALGGGDYRITKTGPNSYDSSAGSTTAMQGDFVLRAKFVLNDSLIVAGMNADPSTDHSYESIDYGIGWLNGVPGILENGVQTASFSANGDLWMWRKGTTVYFGTGPDFATASTTGIVRTATGATQPLYFDTAFGIGNNTVDVHVVEAATRVKAADIPGLRLSVPAGRSDDARLTITPESIDGTSTFRGLAQSVKVTVNAAPSDIVTRGAGTAPTLNISEETATNKPIGKVVGIAMAVDPDALDRNLVSTDFGQLARFGVGEERTVYATGPDGKVVQLLETGQKSGGSANQGGGVSSGLADPVVSSSAYKYSVYVKMDNSFAQGFQFGTEGSLQDAVTGAASAQALFVAGSPSTLQSGRWYRLEGYILPVGHELLASQDLLGGIFDVATGAKVGNANTFRFAPGSQTAPIRFLTVGNEQNQGFSAQWYQPQVEKLDYKYELVGGSALFKINETTGAIVATSNAIDYENLQSHNVTVRVTDRSTNPAVDPVGLVKDKIVTIAVNNLNEPNSFPATPPAEMGAMENQSGAIVGTVQATDIDSSTTPFGQQAYGFWDPVAQTFKATSFDSRYVIDAVSGQIRTATALNYEAMTAPVSYWVAARDNNGVGAYFQTQMQISIAVRDVNEANSFAAPYAMNVNENLGAGAFVGTVSAIDPDLPSTLNGQQRYRFANGAAGGTTTADGRYAINQVTGVITTALILDRETMTAPTTYQVIATDLGTPAFQAQTDVTIVVNNVNERPDPLVRQSQTVYSETLPGDVSHSGRTLATFGLSDVDGTIPSLAILGGNANSWFTTSGGNLNFAAGVNFTADYLRATLGINGQDAGWYYDADGDGLKEIRVATLTLAAVDSGGLQGNPYTYNVFIEDTNERPSGITLVSQTLHSESLTGEAGHPGKTIATLTATDPDGTPPSLSIVGGNAQGWFAMDGGSLKFTSANFTADWLRSNIGGYGVDSAWNYDTDGDGLKEIRVASLTLAATDSRGLQGSPFTYNVLIEDTNERPSGLTLVSQTLHSESLASEAGHPGKTIASFTATDPDGTTPSLAIVGGNSYGWFATDGGSLKFTTANFTADWLRSNIGGYGVDSTWSYDTDGDGLKEIRVATLTLAATDSRGLQGSPFTYNVLIEDKNEAPVWSASAYTFGVDENPASYAWVGTIAGSDIDGPASELRFGFAQSTYYYDSNIGNVSQSPDGRFVINNQTGHVYVNGAQAMDYESVNRSFAYAVQIIDRLGGAHGLAQANILTINLRNANDSATWYTQVPTGLSVIENMAVGTIVSSGVRATDSDGFAIAYSIDPASNPNGAFGVDSSGQIYVASAIDYEQSGWLQDSGGKYANLRVLASDGGTAAAETIRIDIGNVRKYAYNNGALNTALYQDYYRSTYMGGFGGGGDPIYDQPEYVGGGFGGFGQQNWYNEAWLVEKSTGLVVSWMGEYNQMEGTTSRPFPHAGSVADGYTASGTWPNPYTLYSDQEDILSGLGGVPQAGPYYPVVFDLGGDGFDLVAITDSTVTTDLNADGLVERSGWLKPSDGFLVLDRNGDGLVLDWNEISFVKDKAGATTDLEGLVAFDSDGDLKLSAGDALFDSFRLWVDADQDGIGQSGELRSLGDAGIVSISLVRENIQPAAGSITVNSVLATATFERSDGTVGQIGDVALGRLPQAGPAAEPGGPQFRFGETVASNAGGAIKLRNKGTMEMVMSQAMEAQLSLAAQADEPEALPPSAQSSVQAQLALAAADDEPRALPTSAQSSAQAQTDLMSKAAEPAELTERSFSDRKGRYSLTASGGGLYVTGNEPEGAVDSRVQEVRSGSLLNFRNATVGLVAPVVLDLDGDGVELKRSGKSKARFDMDGNGRRDDTGWISKQDGFLVVDLDGDGRITSSAELSLLGLKAGAKSGLDALAALDSDKSGSIDSKDSRFGELKLWVDANGNGTTDSGELRSLADRGIASIGLAARAAPDATVKIGRNALMATSTFTRADGSIGSVGDAALAFRAGKTAQGVEAVVRQVAADLGNEAAADHEARDAAMNETLKALRAGLGSRPFLSLAAEGDSVFDRYAQDETLPADRETSRHRMDMPRLQVSADGSGSVQAEAALAVPAADDLRLAKMVQDMSSFGLRSGEAEWKERHQAAQTFDYFA